MVELAQRVHPVAVLVDRSCPYLVDPADAALAAVLPTVDRIDVRQILVALADCHEQIVVSREPGAPESRVGEDEPLRDVTIGQPFLPLVPPLKSRARLRADQLDII